MATPSIICVRSFEFACRTLTLCERLWNQGPGARHISSQLLKCGTSIGANAEEAQEGQTKADFIAKMSVARKEAREVSYWLRLAVASNVLTERDVAWEQDAATQLLRMIRAAIKTARASQHRGRGPLGNS